MGVNTGFNSPKSVPASNSYCLMALASYSGFRDKVPTFGVVDLLDLARDQIKKRNFDGAKESLNAASVSARLIVNFRESVVFQQMVTDAKNELTSAESNYFLSTPPKLEPTQ